MNPGHLDSARLLSFPILVKPITHVGLFFVTTNLHTFAFALLNHLAFSFSPVGFRFLPMTPASGIDGQSLPWGAAFPWFMQGLGIGLTDLAQHQTSSCQSYFFAPRPSCYHDLEGTGRTSNTNTFDIRLSFRTSPCGGNGGLVKVRGRFRVQRTGLTR